ncbi:MAG: LacI family transcriptional regulator [Spirochaetia bacterium]|nr:LacI family transcriptional regulator [Spirochaetia bacterium]MCF7940113.1 LacI family transcriptional regulator [Spirochaetia bacterium]
MAKAHKRDRRVTISDLAQAAGYSKTAVSFAFNDPGRISAKAFGIITETAKKIGYVPSPTARHLSLQRHQAIGLLLPQQVDTALQNPYIVHIIQGLGMACHDDTYTISLIPPIEESLSEAVRRAAVDGLITLGMHAEMRAVEVMEQRRIPFVTIDGIPSDMMPCVNSSDEQAAYDIMKLVLSFGHRTIAVVSIAGEGEPPKSYDRSVIELRMQGYLRALQEEGVPFDSPDLSIYEQECSLAGGAAAAHVIMKESCRPTVVVCMSDIMAIGCQLELLKLGIQVPDEISLVGHDDIDMASAVAPGITTVRQPGRMKGLVAAQMLLQLIAEAPLEQSRVTVPYSIIKRGSLCQRS